MVSIGLDDGIEVDPTQEPHFPRGNLLRVFASTCKFGRRLLFKFLNPVTAA